MVVVGCHRTAVRTRGRHRHQVAGCHVAGQELILDHDVTCFAVLAHDPREDRGRVRATRCESGGIVGIVEGGANVVAHPAVDRDVGPSRTAVEGDLLDGADVIDSAHGGPDDRSARLDRQPRFDHAEGPALVLDDRADLSGQLIGIGGVVLRRVGDTEATTESHLRHLETELLMDSRVQRQHSSSRDLEP